ncbi:hypothetical protein ES703_55738 [subsurface metagenome]
MTNRNDLGEILRERRKERGWRLKTLSDKTGLSSSEIGRIEMGKRFPSANSLRKLAEPLGFNELELFKIAGFLSRDASDERLDKLKNKIRKELAELSRKILRW